MLLLSTFILFSTWVGSANAGVLGMPAAHTMVNIQDLVACYQDLRSYTTTGSHATVYSDGQAPIFIPGNYAGKAGLWIYDNQGASFVAIDPGFEKKTTSFALSIDKRPTKITYEPASGAREPRIWLRGARVASGTGTNLVFSAVDDAEKRAPLESELEAMAQGMTKTWKTREDRLVKAVNAGQYVWVDVDVDDYREAAGKCSRLLPPSSPETDSLGTTLQSQITELDHQAEQTGVIRDVHPSSFMTTPQY